jgi:hypothetical protein
MGENERDDQWELLKQHLPAGWEEAARKTRAIRRVQGQLSDPERLLRVLLGRAASDRSIREVAAHCAQTGLASVSDVAVHKREKQSADWLEWIVDSMMGETIRALPESSLRLRLVDATCASRPGSTGTDFRLHLGLDLATRKFTHAELTDAKGGESFVRFDIQCGDLMVGDRAYGTARGIAHVLKNGGHPIVRISAFSLPLRKVDGDPIVALDVARTLEPGTMIDINALIREKNGEPMMGRLCIYALPEDEAERAQQRVRKSRVKKQRNPGPRAIESAKYVMIFTTAPRQLLSTAQVFAIYRLRWQVELAFKCLKTVLHYSELPNRRKDTGRTWLLAKLTCALLLERLASQANTEDLSPRWVA